MTHFAIEVRRPAATCLESILVVSLLGMTVLGAVPVVALVHARSRQAVCIDRIRAVSIASRLYAESDPDGHFIPVHSEMFQQDYQAPFYVGAYEYGGKSGVGSLGFIEGPSTGEFSFLTSKYGTRAGFGPASRPLNDILYPGMFDFNNPIFDRQGARADTQYVLPNFMCPSDNGPPDAYHCSDWITSLTRSSYDHFGTSFAANIFMVDFGMEADPYGNITTKSNSPYLRPLSRVPSPERTLAYEENIGRWAWAAIRPPSACSLFLDHGLSSDGIGARGWHGKDWTFNRSFLDTHVEYQAVYIEGSADEEGVAEHYRNEILFANDPVLQATYNCLTVRGDGWQKDTMPAPLIDTGFRYPNNPIYESCGPPQ